MFNKITVLKGDIQRIDSIWLLDKDKLISHSMKNKELPISELINLNKTEVIKGSCYVDFEFNHDIFFTANMSEKVYTNLYEQFILKGNKVTGVPLPVENKAKDINLFTKSPKRKLFYVVIALFFLLSLFSGEKSKTSSSIKPSKSNAELDAYTYCKMAIEDAAKYDIKIPWNNNKIMVPYEDGRFRVAMDIKIQNSFGAYENTRAGCTVRGTSVINLSIGGQAVY